MFERLYIEGCWRHFAILITKSSCLGHSYSTRGKAASSVVYLAAKNITIILHDSPRLRFMILCALLWKKNRKAFLFFLFCTFTIHGVNKNRQNFHFSTCYPLMLYTIYTTIICVINKNGKSEKKK